MKNLCTLALLVSAIFVQQVCADVTGRSFYQPLSITSQQELLSAGNYWYANNKNTKQNALQFGLNGFYQSSVDSGSMASYFFPNGKRELKIAGVNATAGDVSGTWLQIAGVNSGVASEALFKNEYSSTIRIRPSFKLMGTTPLVTYWNAVRGLPWFVTVGLPVGKMETNMHPSEFNISNAMASLNDVPNYTGGTSLWQVDEGFSISALQALNNKNKHFAKISGQSLTATGIGDLFVDLGLQVRNDVQLGMRFDLPTSVKDTAEYLFQPVLGNNGRGAVRAYAQGYYDVLARDTFSLTLNARAEASALLPGHQLRTYDLLGCGSWSRYLLMVNTDYQRNIATSGVNFLTRSTHVALTPQADINLGIRLHAKQWSLGAGYNLAVRAAERLTLYNQMPANTFVVGAISIPGAVEGIAAQPLPVSINQHAQFLAGAPALPARFAATDNAAGLAGLAVTNVNLDVASASMPQYLSNQFSLQGGYECVLGGYKSSIALGTNYAVVSGGSHSNTFSLFGSFSIKI